MLITTACQVICIWAAQQKSAKIIRREQKRNPKQAEHKITIVLHIFSAFA